MTQIAVTTSDEVVLTALNHLKNGRIEATVAFFADEFTFNDHGIGLEFKNKERLAEFFHKTRELYPDFSLQPDTVFVSGDRVIIEWALQFTLAEPLYGPHSRQLQISLRGASIVRTTNGMIVDWSEYYDGLTSRRTALASHFTEWVEL